MGLWARGRRSHRVVSSDVGVQDVPDGQPREARRLLGGSLARVVVAAALAPGGVVLLAVHAAAAVSLGAVGTLAGTVVAHAGQGH